MTLRDLSALLYAIAAVLACGSSPSAQSGATENTATADVNAEANRRAAAKTQIQFGAVYEHLSKGYSPWRSASLELRTGRGGSHVHVGIEETTRFSLLDHNVTLGVGRRVGSRWTVTGEAQSSPSHHVSAIWGARGHGEFIAGGGWSLNAGLLHRRYSSASVDLAEMGVERYVARYRAAYSFYRARLHGGETSTSHRAQGDLYYGPLSSSTGLSVSMGDEIENVAPFGVLRADIRAAAVVGRHWIRPTWFVTYDAVVHEQGAFYTRRRMSVGLAHRF
jgi:YaiO family outer membrane protein